MVALEMPTSNAARPGQGSDLGIQIPSEMDCSHGKRNLIGLPFSFIPQKMCVFLKRLSNKNAKQRFFVFQACLQISKLKKTHGAMVYL